MAPKQGEFDGLRVEALRMAVSLLTSEQSPPGVKQVDPVVLAEQLLKFLRGS